jgi:hypothetical protein
MDSYLLHRKMASTAGGTFRLSVGRVIYIAHALNEMAPFPSPLASLSPRGGGRFFENR